MIKNKSIYKGNSNTPVVYKLIIGDKFYIGGTKRGLGHRRPQHLKTLEDNMHGNYKIQELYNQGKELEFEILEFCERDNVLNIEQKYLDMYKDDPNCLNICFVAGSVKGIKRTEEHMKAIGDGSRNFWLTAPADVIEARKTKLSRSLREGYASGRLKPHGKGRGPAGEKCYLSKLKEQDILRIYELRKQGTTHKEIAMMYNVTREAITMILNGKSWKTLYKEHFKPEDNNAKKESN